MRPLVRGSRQQSDIPSQQADYPPPASTARQPDILQDASLRRQLHHQGGARHKGADWKPSDDQRVPKAALVNRSVKLVASGVPQKVLDQNLVRSDLEIGNNTGAICLLNYGQPAFANSGLPLANNSMFVRQGLACPNNEIWVTGTIVGGIVTVYEGLPPQDLPADNASA